MGTSGRGHVLLLVGLGRIAGDIDVDGVAFDANGKRRLPKGRIELVLPISDVELPAVPGTGDHISLKPAVPQRASLMRTNSVERIDFFIRPKQGDDSLTDDELPPRTRLQLREACDPNPL